MVKLKQISKMIVLCNNAGQTGLSKDLNHIRGIALGKPFGDFAYECQQAIENYPSCPKELIVELNKIMYG